jgi:hypothetical protein
MSRRILPVSILLLAAFVGCSRSLSQGEAQDLVRAYLAPFKADQLTFKSMIRTQVPATGDAYVVVADFVVPYKPGVILKPMPNQTFTITFNELAHRFEINPQLTGVAHGIQGMIDMQKTADNMRATPYNPSPWNKR